MLKRRINGVDSVIWHVEEILSSAKDVVKTV